MNRVLERLQSGLVASCQPTDFGPLDRPDIVAAMAQAAVAGGARGLRIEGVDNLRAVRSVVDVPIIGIVKTETSDTPVRITVSIDDARALTAAGADIVAYDATDRPRRDSADDVLRAIHDAGALAMADCATLEDGKRALSNGAAILGTTLSGYTAETASADDGPDLGLVRSFCKLDCFVMAEGRFDTPELAAAAIEAGANAVTVGSSLTRLEIVSSRFADAISAATPDTQLSGFAVDLGGTKTAAARIDAGRISKHVQAATDGTAGSANQIEMIAQLLGDLGYCEGDRLGVAVTGRVDADGVWHAVNRDTLAKIQTVPLAMMLAEKFGSASLINDAAAATLAEHKLGAGRGHENFGFITISTGVGGGLILNGRLHQSSDGLAGHIGFASAPNGDTICGSGRTNTVESQAAGWAIAQAAAEAEHSGQDARAVFEHAKSGAVWAEASILCSAKAIAELSADLRVILGVSRIALGGSIGFADGYLERVQSFVDDTPELFRAELVLSELGK
ncbi:MAG: putative N-acetylmannosamine-6-phosphate 2-epimerase, partial [Boseongicola sp.]